MGAFADEPDFLGDGAVVGAADAELAFIHRAGGMYHHCQVNVIKLAQLDKFGFAAQELNLAVAPQGVPVLNFDVFLRRHRNQCDSAA